GGSGEVHHCVDTLGLLLDLVCQTATAPDIDVVDRTALVGDDLEELGQLRLNRTVLNLGAEDNHQFVCTHD
ncbi:MAG: hypothetical protein E7E68_10605, partial [Staphylococcus sp.]|nr:hypothetical protein [Staphylococcus sp.]